MSALINGIVILAAIVVGFCAKIFFGETVGERSQDVIEQVVKNQSGVDLDTIFKLDDKK